MFKGVVGIESGSKSSVISKIGRHGLETIQSESSNREIPSAVVFGEDQRYFAEVALDRYKANYQNSAIHLIRLLSQTSYSVEGNFINLELSQGYNCFEVDQKDNSALIRGEKLQQVQIFGGYLSYLDQLTRRNLPANDLYVCSISSPNYFNLYEKKSLQSACLISHLPCLEIVNEHIAIGYSYLWFQKKELHEAKKIVLFIDFGDSQACAFAIKFEGLVGQVIFVESERNLGVRDIDDCLYEFLKQQYGSIFQSMNKKGEFRVKEQISKTRKELSSNREAVLVVESVNKEGMDLIHQFSREQLEEIVGKKQIIEKIKQLTQRAQAALQANFDDIEILGGGTRIPFVQQVIKDTLNRDKLGITFLSSETVSRGCAISCAIAAKQLNPLIKIESYKMKGILQEDIQVQADFNGKVKNVVSFAKGIEIPIFGSISFQLNSGENISNVKLQFIEKGEKNYVSDLSILAANNNKGSSSQQIESTQMEEEKVDSQVQENEENKQMEVENSEDISARVIVEFQINENGLGIVRDSRMFQQDKWNRVEVDCENVTYTEQEIEAMINRETEFKKRDFKVHVILDKKNFLEGFIIENLRRLKEDLAFKVNQELLQKVDKVLQESKELINEELTEEVIDRIQQKCSSAMEEIESLLIPKSQRNIVVDDLSVFDDVTKQLFSENKKHVVQIDSLELQIGGKAIGDGGGMMGMFSKKGAAKLKECLGRVRVSGYVLLQLGDNCLSDNGLKEIFSSLQTDSSMIELILELDSSQLNKSKNKFTPKQTCLLIKQLLIKEQQLQILKLKINCPNDLSSLSDAIQVCTHLKQLEITLTEFGLEESHQKALRESLKNVAQQVTLNCINPNGTLIH